MSLLKNHSLGSHSSALIYVSNHHLELGHCKRFSSALFVLSYDLLYVVSHNRGATIIVTNLPSTPVLAGMGVNHPRQKLARNNALENLLQYFHKKILPNMSKKYV